MWLKKLLRPANLLVLGPIIILGFLSFSGMYVLTPILGLAIAAFFLSVIFEGEIYQQNITKALKSLTKPNYLESKVAKDCLAEIVLEVQAAALFLQFSEEFYDLKVSNSELQKTFNALNETLAKKDDKTIRLKDEIFLDFSADDFLLTKAEFKELMKSRKRLIKQANENVKNANSFCTSTPDLRKPEEYFTELLDGQECKDNKPLSKIRGLTLHKSKLDIYLNRTPKFIIDYANLAKLDHFHSHKNLSEHDNTNKENLEVSLAILEETFTKILFPSAGAAEKSATAPFLASHPKEALRQEYLQELRAYLQENYAAKYQAELETRRPYSRAIIALASVCGILMILGTSYLLVEAFTVVPFLSGLPFGILPAIIVPLAVIAAVSWGIMTYRSMDEMLNNGVVTKRWDKVKQDFSEGVNLYLIAKVFFFTCLIALSITLTICTAGTWYTILKNTRPLFSWLSKIPAAVIGIISGILAISSFAFNISNTAQTIEEIDEYVNANAPEDHPYNIKLREEDEGCDYKDLIKKLKIEKIDGQLTIIKQGEKYRAFARGKDGKWQLHDLPFKDTYFLKSQLQDLDFDNDKLYYSKKNSLLYMLLRKHTGHVFVPSQENWWQFLNPFRLLLLVTYVPIKAVFFLGHLVSISAISDRIPGIPEIISMLIGFVAELFEDWHYFVPLDHTHKPDMATVIDEHFEEQENGAHDHGNDIPSWFLRDVLFAPLFAAAALWHSWASARIETPDDDNTGADITTPASDDAGSVYVESDWPIVFYPLVFLANQIITLLTVNRTVSYEDALDKLHGLPAKTAVKFEYPSNGKLVTENSELIEQRAKGIDDKMSLSENTDCTNAVLDLLISNHDEIDDTETADTATPTLTHDETCFKPPRLNTMTLFGRNKACCAPRIASTQRVAFRRY